MGAKPFLKPKQSAFLKAFAETANLTRAAKAAKIDRAMHYRWLDGDELYKTAFAEARKLANQTLEDEAVRRAREGTIRPVFYQGELCGEYFEYSDTLLMFLLRSLEPEKYRENVSHEHSGRGGGPIEVRPRFTGTFEELLSLYRQTIAEPAA